MAITRHGAVVYYLPTEGAVPINLNDGSPWTILDADIHTFEWEPNAAERRVGDVLKQFDRPGSEITMTIQGALSSGMMREYMDVLHNWFQTNIAQKKPGKLIWTMPDWDDGDYRSDKVWYIWCYAVASETVAGPAGRATNEITFYCPYPQWIREHSKVFSGTGEIEQGSFLDYTYGFNYDYRDSVYGMSYMINTSPFEADFRMRISSVTDKSSIDAYNYHIVENPTVWINGHEYSIAGTLSPVYGDQNYDERITINSLDKTVTHWSALNDKTDDWFNRRGKRQSVFSKIPGGELTIAWSGNFYTQLMLYEERSEPPWTEILDS